MYLTQSHINRTRAAKKLECFVPSRNNVHWWEYVKRSFHCEQRYSEYACDGSMCSSVENWYDQLLQSVPDTHNAVYCSAFLDRGMVNCLQIFPSLVVRSGTLSRTISRILTLLQTTSSACWKRFCFQHTSPISALDVLRWCALQIYILLTYLVTITHIYIHIHIHTRTLIVLTAIF